MSLLLLLLLLSLFVKCLNRLLPTLVKRNRYNIDGNLSEIKNLQNHWAIDRTNIVYSLPRLKMRGNLYIWAFFYLIKTEGYHKINKWIILRKKNYFTYEARVINWSQRKYLYTICYRYIKHIEIHVYVDIWYITMNKLYTFNTRLIPNLVHTKKHIKINIISKQKRKKYISKKKQSQVVKSG